MFASFDASFGHVGNRARQSVRTFYSMKTRKIYRDFIGPIILRCWFPAGRGMSVHENLSDRSVSVAYFHNATTNLCVLAIFNVIYAGGGCCPTSQSHPHLSTHWKRCWLKWKANCFVTWLNKLAISFGQLACLFKGWSLCQQVININANDATSLGATMQWLLQSH